MPIDPTKAQGLIQGMQSQEGLGPLKKWLGMADKPEDAMKVALDERKQRLQSMKDQYAE